MQVTITFDTAKSTPDEIIRELQALFAVPLQEPIPGQVHMDELPSHSTTDQAPSAPAVQTVAAPTATINGSVPEVPDGAIPEAPVVPTQQTPAYTLEQLAVAATPLMDSGKGDALVALLHQFGVDSLVALPAEQYGAFAADLRGLGAKL